MPAPTLSSGVHAHCYRKPRAVAGTRKSAQKLSEACAHLESKSCETKAGFQYEIFARDVGRGSTPTTSFRQRLRAAAEGVDMTVHCATRQRAGCHLAACEFAELASADTMVPGTHNSPGAGAAASTLRCGCRDASVARPRSHIVPFKGTALFRFDRSRKRAVTFGTSVRLRPFL